MLTSLVNEQNKRPLLVLSFDPNKMIKLKLFNWWPVFLFVAYNRIKEKKSTHLDKGKHYFWYFYRITFISLYFACFCSQPKSPKQTTKTCFGCSFPLPVVLRMLLQHWHLIFREFWMPNENFQRKDAQTKRQQSNTPIKYDFLSMATSATHSQPSSQCSLLCTLVSVLICSIDDGNFWHYPKITPKFGSLHL